MFTVADTGCTAQISLMKDVLLLIVSRWPLAVCLQGPHLKIVLPSRSSPRPVTCRDYEGLAISVHLKDSSSGSRISCVLLWDPPRASGAPHLLPHSIPDPLPFLSQMLIPTGLLNKHSKLHFRICFVGNPIHNSWSEKTVGAGPVCRYKKIMDE